MREKSSQAAEQRRADHAEERAHSAQEELRAAQWQASSILSEARKTKEEADRCLEVCVIREAQGASVAYVPEDGARC